MTTPRSGGEDSGDSDERWLTPGVAGVGVASLFSDAGHELVTSLLPTFATPTLHSSPPPRRDRMSLRRPAALSLTY